jgi:hypothetical protein
MTAFRRRTIILFTSVQLIGLVCDWTWQFAPQSVGSFLWGTALIALFPGNIVSAVIVEKLLWNSGLTLVAFSVIEIPILLAINAVLWFGIIGAARRVML